MIREGADTPRVTEITADPETPLAQATVALQAVVDPPAPQVVWHVDGEPFEVVDYPYATRWPLSPGVKGRPY